MRIEQTNEDIELVIPVYRGEEERLIIWLTSLWTTRGDARVCVTLVDADGVRTTAHPALAAIPASIEWCDGTAHRGDHARLLEAGFAHARQARPASAFVAVSHADVVALADGWLDAALERLMAHGVYVVSFAPAGRLVMGDGHELAYPDDWLLVARREVFDEIGFGPPELRGFAWAAWLHIAIGRRGWHGAVIDGGDYPLAVHAAARLRTGRGRHADAGVMDELAVLRRETERLFTGASI